MKKYITKQRILQWALTGTVCNLCIVPSYGMDTEGMTEHKKTIIPIKANLNDYTGLEKKARQYAAETQEVERTIALETAAQKAIDEKASLETKLTAEQNAAKKAATASKKAADDSKKNLLAAQNAAKNAEAEKAALKEIAATEREKTRLALAENDALKKEIAEREKTRLALADKNITEKQVSDKKPVLEKAAVVVAIKPVDKKEPVDKTGTAAKPAPQKPAVVIKPGDEKPTPEKAASPKETVKEETSSEKKADSENNLSNAPNLSEGRYYIANNVLARSRRLTYTKGEGITQTLMGSESENEKSVWHITPAQEQEYKGYYTIQRSPSFGGGYLSYTSDKGYTAEVYMDSKCNPGGNWYTCALWNIFPVESGFTIRNFRFPATGTGYLSCIQDASKSEDSSIKLVNEDVSKSLNDPKFVWHFSRIEDNNSIQSPLNVLQAASLSATQNSQEQLGHLKPSVTTASTLKTSDEHKSTIPPLTTAPITTTSTIRVNSTTTAGHSITVEENVFTFDESKYYKIINKSSNFCLNCFGSAIGQGSVGMRQDQKNEFENHRFWKIIKKGEGDLYKLINKHSGNVLNIFEETTTASGIATMQPDDGVHENFKLWNFVKHGNGLYKIQKQNGAVLENRRPDESISMGKNNSDSDDHQLWRVIES